MKIYHCGKCDGDGYIEYYGEYGHVDCSQCNGTGHIIEEEEG